MEPSSDVVIRKTQNPGKEEVLSPFFCRELLYDYSFGLLGEKRRKQVEAALSQSEELRVEYANLAKGIETCKSFSALSVRQEMMDLLQERESLWAILRKKLLFSIPEPLRVFSQALSIAMIAALFMTLFPWSEMPIFSENQGEIPSVELATISFTKKSEEKDLEEVAKPKKEVLVAKLDSPEKKQEELKATVKPKKEAIAPKVEKKKVVAATKPEKKKVVKASPKVEKKEVVAQKKKKPIKKTAVQASVRKGYVYRAYMKLSGLNLKAKKIAQKIREMGGKKAGKVDLGWKTKGGRYFHFSLAKSKYDEILKYLNSFGPVRIHKDEHRRIMPKGQERFILWIE